MSLEDYSGILINFNSHNGKGSGYYSNLALY